MLFGLRTGADVLGVLYLVSECILHLDREVFWIGRYLASLCMYLVFWIRRCTVQKNPQKRGGRALLMEGNQRQAATMLRYKHSSAGLHLDWIADKSF